MQLDTGCGPVMIPARIPGSPPIIRACCRVTVFTLACICTQTCMRSALGLRGPGKQGHQMPDARLNLLIPQSSFSPTTFQPGLFPRPKLPDNPRLRYRGYSRHVARWLPQVPILARVGGGHKSPTSHRIPTRNYGSILVKDSSAVCLLLFAYPLEIPPTEERRPESQGLHQPRHLGEI